jgi:hypothetical protein
MLCVAVILHGRMFRLAPTEDGTLKMTDAGMQLPRSS